MCCFMPACGRLHSLKNYTVILAFCYMLPGLQLEPYGTDRFVASSYRLTVVLLQNYKQYKKFPGTLLLVALTSIVKSWYWRFLAHCYRLSGPLL